MWMSWKRREADLRGDVFLEIDLRAAGRIAEQILHRGADVAGHGVDEIITLGVHGARASSGCSPSRMRRNPAACSNAFGPRPVILRRLGARLERAVLVAVSSTMLLAATREFRPDT